MTVTEKLEVARKLLEECEKEATEHTSKVNRIRDKTRMRNQIRRIQSFANNVLFKTYPELAEESQS